MSAKKPFLQRYFFQAILPILIFIVGIYFLYTPIRNNIHTVLPDQAYRSAQLPYKKLLTVIEKDHIKTIFNLRGPHENELWYLLEYGAAQNHHMQFYNWSLPAHTMPTQEELQHIIEALEQAPKPILIHCKNGADRSGLVSAFAVILFDSGDLNKANKQIAFRYLAFSPNSVGRLVMPKYENWLEKNHLKSRPENLIKWVNSPNPLN